MPSGNGLPPADNPLVTGEPHIRCYAGYPIQSASGEVLGSLCLMDSRPRDFPPRQLALLRICNHHGIVTFVEQSPQTSIPHREPLSVLMIDVDHFKRVNESHGRAVGDRVMKAIVRQLRAELRSTDNVGRIGDDAFLVVQPNTTAAAANA